MNEGKPQKIRLVICSYLKTGMFGRKKEKSGVRHPRGGEKTLWGQNGGKKKKIVQCLNFKEPFKTT